MIRPKTSARPFLRIEIIHIYQLIILLSLILFCQAFDCASWQRTTHLDVRTQSVSPYSLPPGKRSREGREGRSGQERIKKNGKNRFLPGRQPLQNLRCEEGLRKPQTTDSGDFPCCIQEAPAHRLCALSRLHTRRSPVLRRCPIPWWEQSADRPEPCLQRQGRTSVNSRKRQMQCHHNAP